VDRKFTSILDELSHAPIRDRDLFIEHRAEQVIASFTNLMKLIRESYAEETAADLHKRLLNAVKTGDEEKFRRGIKLAKTNKGL